MAPGTLLVNAIVVMADPEHIVCAAGVAIAVAIGLITTVAVVGAAEQPLVVAVIVKVTVTGAVVVLIMKPEIVLPDPLAGMPPGAVAVLSLDHVKVVPATPVSTIGVMVLPEHIV